MSSTEVGEVKTQNIFVAMRVLCWNYRGCDNPQIVQILRRWSKQFYPDIVFLSETLSVDKDMNIIREKVGYSNGFVVSCRGRSGGLSVWWNEGISFSLTSYSQNHICGVVDDGMNP